MSLNFFRNDCQYPPISLVSFGLCDKQDGSKAYPTTTDSEDWIAEVKNEKELETVFTAIDKCVLMDGDEPDRGRCDGMLTTEQHLYLVELKNERSGWQPEAINQLTSTIRFLLENHDLSVYKKKKAFACNKKHKKFAEIDNEINKRLFTETGFRIDIQAEIVVV